ncbi:MAG: GAF domain-containing sensor histidine kinase [Rhodospirillaceae bacterium]|nr:GAF domain-containing sensor histidine kinase [Rhodospirillales bacterium]
MPLAPELAPLPIQTLIDLVQRLSLATSQAEITATVTRAIRRLTDADGATFVFREGECSYYADEDAITPLWKGRRFPLAQCIGGWTMEHGRMAVIDDIRGDDRIPEAAYRPTFVRSLAVAPVRTNTPIAAIGAYWATAKRPADVDIAMLQAIAHAAALALQNLELVNSLKAAAETKARLLTAVGHDLRQPLQSLTLFAGVLEGEATSPTGKAAVGQINAAVDRMANLLGSILALAELGNGGITVQRSQVAVDALLEPLEAEMAPQAMAKGITLRRMPSSARISTDPGLLSAVLRNLMANSIRYTARGRVVVGARRHGDTVTLIVGDTGIGIDAAKQAMIFEEFYQIGNSARDFTSGTGVGLAIVRRLVDILGHHIQVRSIEGRGSLFAVTVPAA